MALFCHRRLNDRGNNDSVALVSGDIERHRQMVRVDRRDRGTCTCSQACGNFWVCCLTLLMLLSIWMTSVETVGIDEPSLTGT